MQISNALMASLLFFSPLTAIAANPPEVKMSDMLLMLEEAGYKVIYNIEAEGSCYNILGSTPEGEEFEMTIDPKNQRVPRKDWRTLTALDVAKKIEQSGYPIVFKIELKGSQYLVKAQDKSHHLKDLQVDTISGDITQ